MKIAIEAQRIFRSNKHGMDFVALEIIRQLQQHDKENQYYIFVSPGPDECLQESSNVKIIRLKMPSYLLWEQIALPLAVKKLKPDVLHCTSNTAPLLCNAPLMLTLHDIIFLEKNATSNKSLYQRLGRIYRRMVVPRILPKCRKIITVSEFERLHILETLPELKERLFSVHNGYNPYFYPREEDVEISRKYQLPSEYLFFLGNTDPKKNAERLFKAYALYREKSLKKLPLVVADLDKKVLDILIDKCNCPEIGPYIIHPGYIANKDLPFIYSRASVFLYPSLRESFGIPILEAMACGTPVITSNCSAMPEIAGSGALMITPQDEKNIAETLLRLEESPSLREEQVNYGLSRVKLFSWETTAEKTRQLYESFNPVLKK